MATQQKNTASSKKKVPAKISSPRKPAPKMKKTDLRDLKEDKEFTDVTLACEDGQQVGAHKVVLIAPSPFFEKKSWLFSAVSSNVSSNHMFENIQNHIGCICRYFVFFQMCIRLVWFISSRDVGVV